MIDSRIHELVKLLDNVPNGWHRILQYSDGAIQANFGVYYESGCLNIREYRHGDFTLKFDGDALFSDVLDYLAEVLPNFEIPNPFEPNDKESMIMHSATAVVVRQQTIDHNEFDEWYKSRILRLQDHESVA